MDYFEPDSTNELEDRLHARLINDVVWDTEWASVGRERELEEIIGRLIADEHLLLSAQERAHLIRRLLDRVAGLGPIERYVRDDRVSEIMVNGPNSIWVQYQGEHAPRRVFDDRFRDEDHVLHIINQIVGPAGRRIDELQPTVDVRLRDGSRVNAAIRPISLNGPVLTIRKFAKKDWTLDALVREGSMPIVVSRFLQQCVRGKVSMLVAGGTNAGKTTTLNALSSHIPDGERIVTIEDTAELQLNQQNVVRLEARPANAEGTGEITIRDLVRNALRMRPDRIVVGECRGPEALDMLQAMNTGHDGSLTTIHANSIEDAISRLETLTLMAATVNLPLSAVRDQIRGSLRLVLQQRLFPDGKRRVTSVGEILRTRQVTAQGVQDDRVVTHELYRFYRVPTPDQTVVEGYWECVGRPEALGDLSVHNVRVDPSLFAPGRVS